MEDLPKETAKEPAKKLTLRKKKTKKENEPPKKKRRNLKRKLRTFMNPDSNLARDAQTVMSVASSAAVVDDPMKGGGSRNENQHVMKLRYQLEFYLGDANLY